LYIPISYLSQSLPPVLPSAIVPAPTRISGQRRDMERINSSNSVSHIQFDGASLPAETAVGPGLSEKTSDSDQEERARRIAEQDLSRKKRVLCYFLDTSLWRPLPRLTTSAVLN